MKSLNTFAIELIENSFDADKFVLVNTGRFANQSDITVLCKETLIPVFRIKLDVDDRNCKVECGMYHDMVNADTGKILTYNDDGVEMYCFSESGEDPLYEPMHDSKNQLRVSILNLNELRLVILELLCDLKNYEKYVSKNNY